VRSIANLRITVRILLAAVSTSKMLLSVFFKQHDEMCAATPAWVVAVCRAIREVVGCVFIGVARHDG
jgi:hypothetical protein